MANIKLTVAGITCGGCEKSIRNALLAQEGVSEAVASRATGIVDIAFDENRIGHDKLKRAIEDAGFHVAA